MEQGGVYNGAGGSKVRKGDLVDSMDKVGTSRGRGIHWRVGTN
jgi:hypothetical protein